MVRSRKAVKKQKPRAVAVKAQPVEPYTNPRQNLIKPKTENQRSYVRAIIENDVVLCSGPSGSGKSLVALSTALDFLMRGDKPQSRIFITRPMVATSERDFPYIKGSLYDKVLPYFAPILANLEDLLGSKKVLEQMLEDETIVMQAIELMRGYTYKNCCVLITESQNMTISQAVMAITRLGENCKMVFEGDTDQKDLYIPDGLSFLKDRMKNRPDLCGMISMGPEDILRHPLIGEILKTLDYRGKAAHGS